MSVRVLIAHLLLASPFRGISPHLSGALYAAFGKVVTLMPFVSKSMDHVIRMGLPFQRNDLCYACRHAQYPQRVIDMPLSRGPGLRDSG